MNAYMQTETLIREQAVVSPPKRPERSDLNLERPLYVKGDAVGNLLSLVTLAGMLALVAWLAYIATTLLINLYLITHLNARA